jgi:hypothetical protein
MRDPMDIMADAVRPLLDGKDVDPHEAARALVATLADAGYVVVPREPTEDMLQASEQAGPPPPVPGGLSDRQKAALIAYRAMIAPRLPRS